MTAPVDEPHIGLIVEGRGEREAAPLLLRAHLYATGEYRDLLGAPVVCHGRDKALRQAGVEGFVATAAGRPGCVGVIVILDSDDDHACELGPQILERAVAITPKPVLVCLSEPSFEEWIVASAETMELEGLVYDSS